MGSREKRDRQTDMQTEIMRERETKKYHRDQKNKVERASRLRTTQRDKEKGPKTAHHWENGRQL